eukprot:m.36276 g.36276  ORF g.36276 m.36276 type:complete len:58 (+) comp10080_c0_seq5:762-935(+)
MSNRWCNDCHQPFIYEGIVFRTSLLVEINNTKIERNKVIEETKKIERNTKDSFPMKV